MIFTHFEKHRKTGVFPWNPIFDHFLTTFNTLLTHINEIPAIFTCNKKVHKNNTFSPDSENHLFFAKNRWFLDTFWTLFGGLDPFWQNRNMVIYLHCRDNTNVAKVATLATSWNTRKLHEKNRVFSGFAHVIQKDLLSGDINCRKKHEKTQIESCRFLGHHRKIMEKSGKKWIFREYCAHTYMGICV